jgi:acyl carrier protein
MTNLEKYNRVLKNSLRLEDDELNENLMYNRHKNWDSVAHIDMVSALEEAFDVQFSTIEIMRFSTYRKGIEILEKLGVKFD